MHHDWVKENRIICPFIKVKKDLVDNDNSIYIDNIVYKMSLKITLTIDQKFMRLENQDASAVQTQLEMWLMWSLYLYGYKDVFAKEF